MADESTTGSEETGEAVEIPLMTETGSPNVQIYKVPGQLQWLLENLKSNNKSCWIFYSRVQHRFKCKTQHPNSPGLLVLMGELVHQLAGRMNF